MEKRKFKKLEEVKNEYIAYVIYNCDTLAQAAFELGVCYKTLNTIMKAEGMAKEKTKRTYYQSKHIAEKFPKITEADYCCTPNLTPKEWEFLKNREMMLRIPARISSSIAKK